MAAVISLVQNDQGPALVFSVKNRAGAPVNLAGSTQVLHFRAVGSTQVKESLPCTLLAGLEVDDGEGGLDISYEVPYNVPGAGGRVQMDWTPTALDTPGDFEGELEITFSNGKTQTVFSIFQFLVRPEIA